MKWKTIFQEGQHKSWRQETSFYQLTASDLHFSDGELSLPDTGIELNIAKILAPVFFLVNPQCTRYGGMHVYMIGYMFFVIIITPTLLWQDICLEPFVFWRIHHFE